MIRSYIILFIVAFTLAVMDAPIWAFILTFFVFVIYYLHTQFYPLLFEKDVNKIMEFLKKSKNKQHQFTYYFMQGNTVEAEALLNQIKPQSLRDISTIMLLIKQEQYREANDLLPKLQENEYKWYYGAILSLKLNQLDVFEDYKNRVKDSVIRSWIDMEQLAAEGKTAEAIELLDKQLPTLRGLKLLSAYAYKKELELK